MLSAAFSMNRSNSGTWRVSFSDLVVVLPTAAVRILGLRVEKPAGIRVWYNGT